MEETQFDQSVKVLANASGRRDAVRSLGMAGMALLAALGLGDASAKNNHSGDSGKNNGGKGTGNSKNRGKNGNRRQTQPGHDRRHRSGETEREETPDDPAGPEGVTRLAGTDEGGAQQVQAEGRRKKKRGPTGPTGPAGPAGSDFDLRREISGNSNPLPLAAGSNVSAFANCGGEGKAIACSYQLSGSAAQLANTVVQSFGSDSQFSGCGVNLTRTTDVGSSAGATTQAIAICRD
jgi:hypothetical protein